MAASSRPESPTVDADEIARFERLAATWWDPRGKMGVLHKFNPVRLGFIKEAACRQFEPRSEAARQPRGAAHPRHRLRRRHPERAAGAARRRHGRRRPGRRQYRGGAAARRAGRPRDRLPRHHRGGAGGCRRALRRGARHGGGRARRRRVAVRQALRRDGEARRHDGRGDAQPHDQELRAGDRRRRIRAAAGCRAAPTSGTSS